MSYILNNEIKYADSINIDAFNRLRVSEPYNLFGFSHTLTSGETYFETVTVGSATATFLPNEAAENLAVTTTGDRAIREQHGYNFYQPGKSQLVFLTGVFGSGVASTRKYMGYMNDKDGLYFGYSGTTFGVGLRTSTSGSAVDTFIPQSDWNVDTLNTGSTRNPSGIHLDNSKTNIYVINFQWLGVGRVTFALDIDGVLVPVHQIMNANKKTEVYMRTGNLPVRYEVSSTGGATSMKQICASVISEGGQQDYGYPSIASTTLATARSLSNGVRGSVVSTRLSTTFEGLDNRMKVAPIGLELYTTSNATGYWELILQRSHLGENNLGGTPTWTQIRLSPVEQSINGTTVTSGITIASGFISSTSDRIETIVIPTKDFLSLNLSGNTSDWLHLCVTPTSNSSWYGSITMNSKY
jgi:hypothetical protein